jgi:hypothetical protein
MTVDGKTETKANPKEAAAAPAAQAASAAGPEVQVIERKDKKDKKKKKRRKYSAGLKDVQLVTRGVVNSSDRLGRAVAAGFTTFRKANDKSSRKRRDGAIQDAVQNWAKAMGKSVRVASSAPFKFARNANTKTVRRTIQYVVRTLAFPLSPFLR